MNDALLKFTEIIDEEITAYEDLSKLYDAKKDILIKRKNDELWDVDAKIVEKAKEIRQIDAKRKESAKYFGNENIKMSEVIEKIQDVNDELTERVKTQTDKLQSLATTLKSQENENLLLIQHGITITQKKTDIILNVLAPHSKQYNKEGKNIDIDKQLISFVEEEA